MKGGPLFINLNKWALGQKYGKSRPSVKVALQKVKPK
jgi:hypothetical protein